MKTFKGKAIYNPSGKAGEYSYWACSFYVGCSNGCTYCYCKKGILAHAMGGNTPKLKACFKDDEQLEDVYTEEVLKNREELRKHGVFLFFTSDPCLKETIDNTIYFTRLCVNNRIPVKILTKSSNMLMKHIERFWFYSKKEDVKKLVAFGFTLTGHDELEPNASTNAERIEAMRKLHAAGFKTWASIEPIVDIESSMRMLDSITDCCDLVKIGLMSGKRYNSERLRIMIAAVCRRCELDSNRYKIYFKDSLLKQAGINREYLPENCVGRDYNIFND